MTDLLKIVLDFLAEFLAGNTKLAIIVSFFFILTIAVVLLFF